MVRVGRGMAVVAVRPGRGELASEHCCQLGHAGEHLDGEPGPAAPGCSLTQATGDRRGARIVAEAGSLWWWPQVVEIGSASDVSGAATQVAAVLGVSPGRRVSEGADRVQDDHLARRRGHELAQLSWHWGEAYQITWDGVR